MAFTYDFSKEQIEAAVESGGGTVKGTAKSLNCTWLTARKYIVMYGFEAKLHQIATDIGILAEETIMGMILHAAEDYDYASKIQPTIIFTAKCKRGWIETSGLLIGEDLRSPHERFMDAVDSAITKRESEPVTGTESGEGTEPEPCES